MADGRLFSGAPQGPLSIARQNSRPLAILRSASALRFAPGAGPVRPPPFVAMKAAMGAADPTKGSAMTTDHDDAGYEPPHASSPTDHVLAELQLYGYRPFQDEPDPRPLPESRVVAGAVADIFDALVVTFADTRLEPDLEDLLWSTVNLFHRAVSRIERELDDNEQAQRRAQREQDGSEIRSVELERLTAEGQTLSSAGTAWSSSATRPPTNSNATLAPPGGRARDRRSPSRADRGHDR